MAHYQGHICQCLPRLLTLKRDSPLTIAGDRRKTGRQFVEDVLAFSTGLSEFGVRPGDVIAIAALNSDWYIEWLLAITFVGGIAAPLNYRWSLEEARLAIELVSPVMLVVDESCSSWALELQESCDMPSIRMHVLIGDATPKFRNNQSVLRMDYIRRSWQGPPTADPLLAPKGIAIICFTSGTTGKPKGVAISHTALIVQSLAKLAIVGYTEEDVYLHTAPLCHIGGISSCMAMLMAGGCHVVLPKFCPKSSIQAIEQHNVTSLITVPTMIADLISYIRSSSWEGGTRVSKILNGGGSLSVELLSNAIHVFPHAKIVSAYGMTECCSSLTFITLPNPNCEKSRILTSDNHNLKSDHIYQQPGGVCVGKAAPHVEIRISTNDQASSFSPSIGKILTRGLHVMIGYWKDTSGNLLHSNENGWLDTGDIGWLDENGNLWLIGREKGLIKSGGENVYPEEVEAILAQHPGISNVAVVGIPDIRLSEKVVACISMRESWHWLDEISGHSPGQNELSSKLLQKFCRQMNLTGFKIPKKFFWWKKSFPLTTTGKLKRDDVRQEVISNMQIALSKL
ncbi:2-succinylbenzoate--CoA ligase, chloroplastic/peroxisomal-like isoform X2 [Dioscorea cayenensis subsp. rotundata]|uniref:4-coumarate--CoA ligase n=1 Tax=Dioscorea cayennensis subsp. rotundata TaxID=55577 RepID=A0AB40CPB0_DIOCR|nr:2-succinylbenzoate--CoA ligase, chloroplastic/peroxisomal-like isoform X2 [Dioscorea cayenensis subsp. rotundata]